MIADREAVEKRLFVLQQQGYIHAYDTTRPFTFQQQQQQQQQQQLV